MVLIKKICHPQGVFFLSFSGLLGGFFFLRVNFRKGGAQLYSKTDDIDNIIIDTVSKLPIKVLVD